MAIGESMKYIRVETTVTYRDDAVHTHFSVKPESEVADYLEYNCLLLPTDAVSVVVKQDEVPKTLEVGKEYVDDVGVVVRIECTRDKHNVVYSGRKVGKNKQLLIGAYRHYWINGESFNGNVGITI